MENKTIMKKIAAVALALVFLLGSITILRIYAADKSNQSGDTIVTESTTKATTGYEDLFKKDSVKDIYIEVSETDWKSMLADPLAEEYKSASVKMDGITLENVGFRTKGNLTLRSVANSDSDRYSFRIKLDKYVKGQSLLGLDEFVLNNMYADPSYMREYLSYEALRIIGADVPLANFANIYINGELYGFYLFVEAVDDSFLERSFGEVDGNLYKQEQGSTLQHIEGSSYDKSELKVGDDTSKTDLKNFIKILNEMPEGEKGDIEKVLDVDSALRYIAANTVLGNYDSYSGNMAQNYYLYGQDGKFTVIPWDYNMSIGGFGGGGDQTTIPIDEPVLGVKVENLPLIDNLLAVEEYKEEYHGYIKDLLGYLENFEGRVTELAKIIRPYVEADPTKFYTMEQFEANISYSEVKAEAAQTSITPQEKQGLPQQPQNQTGAATDDSKNVNGFSGNRPEPPQGMPEGFENGDRPEPPQGAIDGNMKGGPGGRGMMGGSTSIMNFIRDRVANILQQLSGELPTTGNTTMNNSRGGNGNNR
ncbi:spore coat protein CotH [Anaerosolibacter carboniphilus]|uniref:Spore coat protein CotH n=1 Tax=Anaerosolibacter carboniphilus TaxID=1417629 RepID=A0A841KRI2_9FIRM|nr:CotH kinase family protein [Anaerosolibacter carboniphilus]MBB6216146.1 spore coat protein CotH [Anaerosolibacter carboniphilus]